MYCSKCGTQNIDGVTFCGGCGTQMESHIQQPPQQRWVQNDEDQSPRQQWVHNQGSLGAGMHGANYNAPGDPYFGGISMPKDYMTESIAVTAVSLVCCCSPISLILGIIAIIKANNVKTEFYRGNLRSAIADSNYAKNLTIWAAIIAVIYYMVVAFLYVIGYVLSET